MGQNHSKISIGICAHNEAENIGNLLNNLLNQPLLPHQELLEIIIVCSGCTDGTEDIVRNFQKKDSRIKMINQHQREGKAKAQNLILQEYKGDVLVFLSADTCPAKSSIAILVNTLKGNVAGVDSKVLLLNESCGLANFISHFTWRLHNRTMLHEDKENRLRHLAGDMFAIRRGVVTRIPPYIINDDAYIGMVIRLKGYDVRYVPQAICYILGPRLIGDYIRQRRRVLFGHQQLTRLLGRTPGVLRSIALSHPLDALRIFLEEVRLLKKRDLIKVLVVIVLEIICSLLSLWDSCRGNLQKHILWERVTSTKYLIKKEEEQKF